MKELLLGWLTKPKLEITPMDEFIELIELLIAGVTILFTIALIHVLMEKFKEKYK